MLSLIDNPIVLAVIVIVSIVMSYLQKKQEREKQEKETPSSRPARQQTPKDQSDADEVLEKKLRSLLGLPESSPEPPPPPPPVVERSQREYRNVPPPIPEVEQEEHRSVFDVIEEPNPVNVRVEPAFQELPSLSESQTSFEKARNLQKDVTRHIKQVTHHPVGTTRVQRKEISSDIMAATTMLKNRHSLRTAFVTSVILGPPKSLSD